MLVPLTQTFEVGRIRWVAPSDVPEQAHARASWVVNPPHCLAITVSDEGPVI